MRGTALALAARVFPEDGITITRQLKQSERFAGIHPGSAWDAFRSIRNGRPCALQSLGSPVTIDMRIGSGRTAARAMALVMLAALPGCHDPVQPPGPPSGGHMLTLDYDEFVTSVAPVLARNGCDAGGDCHGGGIRGTLALSPQGAKDPAFDFAQVSLQVDPIEIDSSHILTKPLALAAGGVPHGVKVFATTADSGYQAIHTWLLHGVLR